MRIAKLLAIFLLAISGATTALAHHSGSMFDQSKQQTLTGTVREFQWTNPHAWIQLLVANESGVEEEWSIEMAGPSGLYRSGWRPNTLKAGDKITVVINPMRDGSKGGNFISGTSADNKPLGKKE